MYYRHLVTGLYLTLCCEIYARFEKNMNYCLQLIILSISRLAAILLPKIKNQTLPLFLEPSDFMRYCLTAHRNPRTLEQTTNNKQQTTRHCHWIKIKKQFMLKKVLVHRQRHPGFLYLVSF